MATTFGTPADLNGANTGAANNPAIAELSSRVYVAAYSDGADSGKGKIQVLSVKSGTDITVGSEVQFDAAPTRYYSATGLDGFKVCIVYRNTSNNYLYAVVGSVSGDAATFGTPVQFGGSGTYYGMVRSINRNKVAIVSSDGYCYIGTIVDNTITIQTGVQFSDSIIAAFPGLCRLDDNRFVVVWKRASDNLVVSRAGVANGVNALFGDLVAVNNQANTNRPPRVHRISGNNFLIVYIGGTSITFPVYAKIGSVDGLTITLGAQKTVESSNNNSPVNALVFSDVKAGIFYYNNTNSIGRYRDATLDVATKDVTVGSASTFWNGSLTFMDDGWKAYDKYRGMICFRRGDNSVYVAEVCQSEEQPLVLQKFNLPVFVRS